MADQNQRDDRSTTDQILDLLLDALSERQKARIAARQRASGSLPGGVYQAPKKTSGAPEAAGHKPESKEPAPAERPAAPGAPEAGPKSPRPAPDAERRVPPAAKRSTPAPRTAPRPYRRDPRPGEEGWEPPPRLPSINMGRLLGRLAILVAVLIVLVNVPVNSYGVSLARIMPEATSLIIRDGLVLKGSGPEIYMLEDEQLRWISSMDAFEHLGLTWGDVHVVEDSFLKRFKEGRPIHVLLKCGGSDHIYRLENDQKRWIKDIDTFLAEGHVWDDVRFVSCQYLRDLPTGPSIPEDAGPAPEP
jgi:hypothetical protein